ncbi:hypothetical protein [Streptomyces sp. NL15-2K]|uniref:hypothetical protein n=1 Tax=Streptomyces sp. NL15-2K TaxID=376149 RepID=UPI000F57910B|nr:MULTISPECIES: hypothetical protein [Actinomycetes]WKX08272.1 hypothetical protein Q4V64_12570 [Kutzneria buriramensis]
MTGTGPVEPVNSSETDDSYDIIGVDAPRLADRLTAWFTGRLANQWTGPPPRARKAALTAGVVATAVCVLLLAPTGTSDRADPPPRPTPWPANVTAWRYLGPTEPLTAPTTDTKSGHFRFAVTITGGPPVTLTVTGTAFPGLDAHATPEPDFTVNAGTTRRITVEISVSDCTDLPLNADLPFLDVTLRNTRAIQRHSFTFGGAFSQDFSELLHGACEPTTARPAPRPSGSASSQNADRGENPPNRPRAPSADARPPSRHNKKVTRERPTMPLRTNRA